MTVSQHLDHSRSPIEKPRPRYGYCLPMPSNSPVISIVTYYYNNDGLFHQTAESILGQSLQQWEWIIVNDGSTDQDALKVLERYRGSDPRIRVIDHPENRGLSAARNTGLSCAQCEYVLLVDSDDLLEPTAAEKWWWFLKTHPQFAFVDSYHVAFGAKNYLWTGGFHEGALNAERNRVSMLCMIRKSVWQSVGGFDENIREGLEDWEFWMRCAAQGYWGATIPEYLAWYRIRDDHTDRWSNLTESRIEEFRARFRERYPHLYAGGFPDPPLNHYDLDLTLVSLDYPHVNHLSKSRPRLLLLLPWLVMGGAERFALNLIDQLKRRGWQITVVATASAEHGWWHEFAQHCEDLFVLPNFLPIKDYPRFLSYLIESRQFDALLLQGSHEGYRLLPVLRSLFPHLPMADYLHFVTPDWMHGGFPRLSLLYQDCLDVSVTSCEQVRQWMIAEGANPDKLKVAYIGVDPEIWKPDPDLRSRVRAQLGIGPEDVVILYAARLEVQKQPLLLAKILGELARRGLSFRAWVAGEGSLKGELEAALRENQVQDWVRLLGEVPTSQMPGLMAAADIFFLPSQSEGISQAIYEAMACGLPVVASRVGGQAELVTSECGVLIPLEGEPLTAFAEVMENLIRNPQLRTCLGQFGRQRILQSFTLAHMGDVIESELRGAIEHRKSSFPSSHELVDQRNIQRLAQSIVEYLQARAYARVTETQLSGLEKRFNSLYKDYAQLVEPRPPSYWFYLWLRQLLLPLFGRLKAVNRGGFWLRIKEMIKSFLVRGQRD